MAIEDGLVTAEQTFFDYGCGHGADVLILKKLGIDATGWDPAHRPDEPKRRADVVNLGFVVNVIESAPERCAVLRAAWDLAGELLVVAARLESEHVPGFTEYEDGFVTKTGSFQKFYDQKELREWIEALLDEVALAAAPGIFYVFRDSGRRIRFLAARQRRSRIIPRVYRDEVAFEEQKELLKPLMRFWRDRGRLPAKEEWSDLPEIRSAFGSLKKAFELVVSVTGGEVWDRIRQDRIDDLAVYLALTKFGKRPKRGDLPLEMWYDVKDFWGSYRVACEQCDELLFSLGTAELGRTLGESSVGKVQDNAIYLHTDAVAYLSPVLRVYEGCAKAYIGDVEEANVVKLHRTKPAVTYMSYADFERDPYPQLRYSIRVELHSFHVKERFFDSWDSPPILHQKGLLLPRDHKLRRRCERLSQAEKRFGLDQHRRRAGDHAAWAAMLDAIAVRPRGHDLVRNTA